jgi:hypothetical protein
MAGLTGTQIKATYGDVVQLNNAGAGVPAALQQCQDGLGNATGIWISTTQIGVGSTGDNGLARAAAGVLQVTNGGAGKGWMQVQAGEMALASPATNATAVLAATNISTTVVAGRSYRIDGFLQLSNSTAGEGWQIDFGGGGCSATTFAVAISTISGTQTLTGTVATSLTTALTCSSVTATCYVRVTGYLKVNAGGTLTLRLAENTHSTGTVTLAAGSWIALYDTVNL